MKSPELVLDFIVRWKSTYTMVKRFIDYREIINNIITSPHLITGLRKDQRNKLKTYFSHEKWDYLNTLKRVLEPFVYATEMLSGRNYPTMALGRFVLNSLKHFLLTDLNTTELDAVLKRCLCTKFTYYFETILPTKQQELALVASYFHPFTYKYLKDDEKREAEKLICADIQREKAVCTSETPQPSPPSVQSQATTKKENSQIDKFLFTCGLLMDSTAVMNTDKKILSVREELANYVSRVKPDSKFETFWSENKHDLKCLASLVRRYNVILATSVASEITVMVNSYPWSCGGNWNSDDNLNDDHITPNYTSEHIDERTGN
ncbi:unnamed protein product [Didymodactylos carnosus]|uniref:Uncharacterized protein n=1 Tax=Didymodactylos carnosus TaxID=1234261 RepID=A0A8S2N152_9BILA|nr:unnamed protein product [Didymodactylos carnosus]CAF3982428.1 unnamed protein product [Didymodactylos carnosus]